MGVMHAVVGSASERVMLREVLYKWINTSIVDEVY